MKGEIMKRCRVIFSIILILITAPAFAQPDNDAQYWNTTSVEGEIVKNLKIGMEEEFRFGDDMSALYYQHTDIGLTYKFFDWFCLGPAYRQVFESKNGAWKPEYRPNLNALFSFKLGFVKIIDRNRFEYRILEDAKNDYRYRNKLDIIFPVKLGKVELTPYIADEIFIDMDDGKFVRNRLYAGFGVDVTKHINAGLYYLWQSKDGGTKWIDYNVMGSKLKVKF